MNSNRILFSFILILTIISCTLEDGQNNRVCFNNNCFDVEVAAKQEERMKGLQLREHLGEDEGMLFIFTNLRHHAFWMKDTYIPLDMIWLDHTRRVVDIAENVPPCEVAPCPTYAPKEAALYVLEINAGRCEKLGIQVGDTLDFKLQAHTKN